MEAGVGLVRWNGVRLILWLRTVLFSEWRTGNALCACGIVLKNRTIEFIGAKGKIGNVLIED